MSKKDTFDQVGEYKMWPNPNGDLLSFDWHWRQQAEVFKKSARAIWREMKKDWRRAEEWSNSANPDMETIFIIVDDAYILLLGYCLENLLKCILLHRHPEYIQGNTLEGKHFKSHDSKGGCQRCRDYGKLT